MLGEETSKFLSEDELGISMLETWKTAIELMDKARKRATIQLGKWIIAIIDYSKKNQPNQQ
uniref:DHC_N2 domain-containing protein n=1 Tax=Mesocestoides corti TaxID=53468 RepID=A0A5K3FTU8_MESCO